MGLLPRLVILALLAEASWAGYEWWRQIHDLMALFEVKPVVVAAAGNSRPVLAAVGAFEMPARPMAAPSRRAEGVERAISSLPVLMPTELPVPGQGAEQVLELAKQYLEEHRQAWEIRPYHDFRSQVSENPAGTHVIFTAQQDGIDIEGLTIDITYAPDHTVAGVANLYRPVPRVETGAAVEPAEALEKVSDRFAVNGPTESAQRVLALSTDRTLPELAYWLPVKDRTTGRATQALFRASDGRFLREQLSLALQ